MSAATFLSGNGPLVEVLRDALRSKAFVRDLHAFIKTYGLSTRVPHEHVIVFDEAQRAWDRGYMAFKHNVDRSEPELLIQVGERLPGWAALVGLVGDGQEIHAGEEAGIEQWREAASPPLATKIWRVHCPPRLADAFKGMDVTAHDVLDLTISLRSRRADRLHDWVYKL
ncbi:MAG TPA: DNA/RNA helicase domain-containing protein [Acidimicrobiales bacterium]